MIEQLYRTSMHSWLHVGRTALILTIVLLISARYSRSSIDKLVHSTSQPLVSMGQFIQLQETTIVLDNLNGVNSQNIDNDSSKGFQNRANNCNRFSCFDPLQCKINDEKQLTYYLYPPVTFLTQNGHVIYSTRSMISLEFLQFIETIIKTSRLTDDPKQACLFVPSIDLTYIQATSANSSLLIAQLFDKLPYWRLVNGEPGTNHLKVLLNPGQGVESTRWMNDNSITIASNFDAWTYRREFDFPIHAIISSGSQHDPTRQDKSIISLIFTQYDSISLDQKRFIDNLQERMDDKLLVLGHNCQNNDNNITVKQQTKSKQGSNIQSSSTIDYLAKYYSCNRNTTTIILDSADKTNCRCTRKRLDNIGPLAYPEILSIANFCLILRPVASSGQVAYDDDQVGSKSSQSRLLALGDSSHYLLALAVKHNCIPILDSDIILPYSQVIDWTEISYSIVTHNHIPSIEAIYRLTRSAQPNDLATKHKKLNAIWLKYFQSVEVVACLMMNHLDSLVYPNIFADLNQCC